MGATVAFFSLVELTSRRLWTEQELWPTPFHEVLIDHTTLVWRLRPNMVATLRGGHEPRTNSLGLRDQELILPKPAGRLHVLALGESTTMGDWVAADDAYPEQLEARWIARGPNVEVRNAGVGALSVWQSWVFLAQMGELLDPDIVLVYHQHNDALPLGAQDGKSFYLGVRGTDRQLWAVRRLFAPLLAVCHHSRFYQAVRKRLLVPDSQDRPVAPRAAGGPRVPEPDRWEALSRMAAWCRAHGAALVIVQPVYREPILGDDLLARFAQAQALPFVDLPRQLDQVAPERDPLFVDSVHPTPEGHAFIARAISTVLDQDRIWPDGAPIPTRGP